MIVAEVDVNLKSYSRYMHFKTTIKYEGCLKILFVNRKIASPVLAIHSNSLLPSPVSDMALLILFLGCCMPAISVLRWFGWKVSAEWQVACSSNSKCIYPLGI